MVKIKSCLIFVFFVINYIILVHAEITGDSISTSINLFEERDFDNYNKIIDINEDLISNGFEFEIYEKNLVRFDLNGKFYPIYITNISSNMILLKNYYDEDFIIYFNESRTIEFGQEKDNEVIIEFKNYLDNNSARVKVFFKEDIFADSIPKNYVELFDVDIDLLKYEIENSNDLTLIMKFVNFGEGPSSILVVYSIFDEYNKEIYQGNLAKVVYTEDSVIQKFDSLELDPGMYSIKTIIYYGKNQTAESSKNFVVVSKFEDKKLITIFGLFFVIIIFSFILYFKIPQKINNHFFLKSEKILLSSKKYSTFL